MTPWESQMVLAWTLATDADGWRNTSWYLLGMAHAFWHAGAQEQRDDAQLLSSVAMELYRSAP